MELRDAEGGLQTALGAHPSWEPSVLVDEGTDRELQHVPTFGREPVWGFWGDLIAIGVSSRYEIRAHGADGSLARIVRREHSLRVPTHEDVEAHIESRILLHYSDATPSEQYICCRIRPMTSTNFPTRLGSRSSRPSGAVGALNRVGVASEVALWYHSREIHPSGDDDPWLRWVREQLAQDA